MFVILVNKRDTVSRCDGVSRLGVMKIIYIFNPKPSVTYTILSLTLTPLLRRMFRSMQPTPNQARRSVYQE